MKTQDERVQEIMDLIIECFILNGVDQELAEKVILVMASLNIIKAKNTVNNPEEYVKRTLKGLLKKE